MSHFLPVAAASRRIFHRSLITAHSALFLFSPGSLSAQDTVFRTVYDTATDTHVEVTALFSEAPNAGYVPLRVKAANNLKSNRSLTIRTTSGNAYYSGNISTSSSQTLEIPAGKTVTRDLLIPVSPSNSTTGYGYNQGVRILLSGGFGSTEGFVQRNLSSSSTVLLSDTLFTPNASALDSASSSSGRSYGNIKFSGKFHPKTLPSDWLAYSGYDVIALTANDWADIPPGPRNAIISWVRQGGRLVFADPSFDRHLPGLPENTGLGTISHFFTLSTTFSNAKKFVDLIHKSPAPRPLAPSLANDYESWPLAISFGEKHFNYLIFFLVAIAFSILVGPVNLFVFAKSGKRHRLFFTTPLISLGASLVMIALIILQDGFGGSGRRIALMEIQQGGGGHTAHIHQEQISRSGVLLGPSFTVDPACLISPVVMKKTRWTRYTSDNNTKGTFDLQPASGKLHASGSWWQSRSEQGQYLSAIVPTRGRIERGKETGTWVSSFSFPLETICFRDGNGAWTKAENVKTGVPFSAKPATNAEVDSFLDQWKTSLSARNAALFTTARKRANSFVALTSSAPAIETLSSIRWKETTTIITGELE